MRNPLSKQHHTDGLLALLLLGVFALCVLSVLLLGADVYHRLSDRDQDAYSRRTCAQYLTTKVRQSPDPQALSLSRFGDSDALVFTQEIDGRRYLTRVYCYDGWLRELFSAAEDSFSPEDGQQILEADDLSLSLTQGLLSIDFLDAAGQPVSLCLSLRGGEGAAS